MRQIVPFKKELAFKTKVSDITSISLEREIDIKEDGIVSGVFHISGDYKMNEGSINREEFSFDLPFDISLDPRYDMSTVKVDIDDFYYDIVNDEAIKVNIDLFVEAEYLPEKEEPSDENVIAESEDVSEDTKEDDDRSINETTIDIDVNNTNSNININDNSIEEKEEVDIDNITTDLFSNLDNSETYVTYYVYIVKEDDTIDKILNKYGITKEELEDYNDIVEIKAGDKIIIPKKSE